MIIRHGDWYPLMRFQQDGVDIELTNAVRATYFVRETGETGDLKIIDNGVELPGHLPAGSVAEIEIHWRRNIIETVGVVEIVAENDLDDLSELSQYEREIRGYE